MRTGATSTSWLAGTALIAVLLGSAACSRSPEVVAAPKPPAVTVVAAAQRRVPTYGDYIGQAEAVKSVEVRARVEHVGALVEELTSQRAADRIGETVEVLVESSADEIEGRAAHQGPEVDGSTYLLDSDAQVGDLVRAVVVESDGADLYARAL